MKNSPATWGVACAFLAAICSGCTSMDQSGQYAGGSKMYANPAMNAATIENYGDDRAVLATIDTVKSQGSLQRVGSRAVRLPERALGEIAVYGFQFPEDCGGHRFRVIEVEETQILEFAYADVSSDSALVRDYISGPSPFVRPGLWSAYDHTEDSIAGMTSKFERRGNRAVNSVYSQGLHTNLPSDEQRELGLAYSRALSDIESCRGDSPQTVAVDLSQTGQP